MKTFFIIYLIGFIISGFSVLLSFSNNKFYAFHYSFVKVIMEESDMEADETFIVNVLKGQVKSIMFLSYIGIIKLIFLWVSYLKCKK